MIYALDGAVVGPVIQGLPLSWGGVSGPLGAARFSLARVGWTFVTPLTVRTHSGEVLALTSASPAMVCYHPQVAWKLPVSRSACRAAGEIVYAAEFHTLSRGRAFWAPRRRTMLRAFLTQALWSSPRLYDHGYDVSPLCPKCGEHLGTMFHRLLECACTRDLRQECFTEEELDWLQFHPCRSLLLQGLQLLPELPDMHPLGIGLSAV